jgi:hypothetical protein
LVDREVTDLASKPVGTAPNLSVNNKSATDAGAKHDNEHVRLVSGGSNQSFGTSVTVGVIINDKSSRRLKSKPKRTHSIPAAQTIKVGSKRESAMSVHETRNTNANRTARHAVIGRELVQVLNHAQHRCGHRLWRRLTTFGCRLPRRREHGVMVVKQYADTLGAAKINTELHR